VNSTGPPLPESDTTWNPAATPHAPETYGAGAPPPRAAKPASRRSRKRKQTPALLVTDETEHPAPARKPFIVPCPACDGSGRVLRDESQVLLACRLCWERGVVARIVARQYQRDKPASQDRGAEGTR
jgi:hypothetical protein